MNAYTGNAHAGKASAWMALLIFAVGCAAEGQQPGGGDLSALSLEQLTQLEVNTVSRRDQKLFETPAAAFVITRDDILRSGVTSVPELLRMVPGLEAAQIDANTWAVSARGFNSRFANKMLIMIDNRSIYNPVFSGTLWDQNDLMLEDIERIEVVRGPGGTMWGANAVNGVINIVTRKASDTRGALVAGGSNRAPRFAGEPAGTRTSAIASSPKGSSGARCSPTTEPRRRTAAAPSGWERGWTGTNPGTIG